MASAAVAFAVVAARAFVAAVQHARRVEVAPVVVAFEKWQARALQGLHL